MCFRNVGIGSTVLLPAGAGFAAFLVMREGLLIYVGKTGDNQSLLSVVEAGNCLEPDALNETVIINQSMAAAWIVDEAGNTIILTI